MTEEQSATVVYLDAMAFIFAIEGEPSVSEPVKALFDILRRRPGNGVTSELTLAEVLAGSEGSRIPPIRRAYFDLIVWSKFLDLLPVDRVLLCESADLRFMHREAHGRRLKLPDAIHLVTAIRKRCRYFISADKGIKLPVEMTKVLPDADGIAEILRALT